MSRRKTQSKPKSGRRIFALRFAKCGNCGHSPGAHLQVPAGQFLKTNGHVTPEDLIDEARRQWCFGYPDPIGACECRQFTKPEWA